MFKKFFDIAGFLNRHGITRDDALWFWGKFAGIVMFFAAMGVDQSAALHISPGVTHFFMFLAAWVTVISAQFSTSSLNGAPAPQAPAAPKD